MKRNFMLVITANLLSTQNQLLRSNEDCRIISKNKMAVER